MMDLFKYTPHLIEGQEKYAEILIEVRHCFLCRQVMVASPYPESYGKNLFPGFCGVTFEAQIKRAGWILMSEIKVDDAYICQECAKAGKADFLCASCGQRKPTNRKKESFGDPPEFLCLDCYETVPAKVWDEKVEDLREKHRYDFE